MPVKGVFSGSVCACNPNAIDKQNTETEIDFFIVECRDGRLARKQRDVASNFSFLTTKGQEEYKGVVEALAAASAYLF